MNPSAQLIYRDSPAVEDGAVEQVKEQFVKNTCEEEERRDAYIPPPLSPAVQSVKVVELSRASE